MPQLFLARRDGRVVGRISAQIDHAFNRYQGNAWGQFGFLETEDDADGPGRAAGRRRRLAGRARPRPDGRADGLLDERRERGADRRPRPRSVHQAALAPALLPATVRAGRADQGGRPVDVGAAHHRPREGRAGAGGHGREARARPRHPHPQDVAPAAEPGDGALRRDLQRGLEGQLGLRALLGGGPQALRPGAAAGVRPQLVHDRRAHRHRRERGGGHHGARHQPGAEADERPDRALRLVALPAPAPDHGPRARGLSGRQARVPAHRRGRRPVHRALRHGRRRRPRSGARWAGSWRPTTP